MVYNLRGRPSKQINGPGLSIDRHAMAICGDDSVVVSDCGSNSVFRVNIDSGDGLWTSNLVSKPEGVVCYKNRYVLVTNCNTDTRIWIGLLDAETGVVL